MRADLEIRNLSVAYRENQFVVQDISFDVQAGSIAGIMGPSGSGKSTILRAAGGILGRYVTARTRGTIQIGGRSPRDFRANGSVGMMFQEHCLLPHMNLEQNVALPVKLAGLPEKNQAIDLLKLVGLENARAELPSRLSGGMKARVALARAFVTDPGLVLLDEPFGALDIPLRRKLHLAFQALLQATQATGLLVTHDLEDVIALCDRCLVLTKEGRSKGIVVKTEAGGRFADDIKELLLR